MTRPESPSAPGAVYRYGSPSASLFDAGQSEVTVPLTERVIVSPVVAKLARLASIRLRAPVAAVCGSLKDQDKNGSRSLDDVAKHVTDDRLVI